MLVKEGGTVQKKGFTNMAQAFALAETMYTASGRAEAQSAFFGDHGWKAILPLPNN